MSEGGASIKEKLEEMANVHRQAKKDIANA